MFPNMAQRVDFSTGKNPMALSASSSSNLDSKLIRDPFSLFSSSSKDFLKILVNLLGTVLQD